jgi:phosphoglycolate phosphatase
VTPTHIGPEQTALRALLNRSKCLLLDFDGPVCRLFHREPAGSVAARMHRYVAEHRIRLDDPAVATSIDPHQILRAPMPRNVQRVLETIVTEGEVSAARSASPTPGAHDFIRAVADGGRQLAITTNNAPSAVAAYLKEHDLDACFGPHIYGRGEYPSLMKPHPDPLLRAMNALDVVPMDCLMIGDSAADAAAARAAGVGFLGYARSPDRVARLRAVDPHPVVIGMNGLVAAARSLLTSTG